MVIIQVNSRRESFGRHIAEAIIKVNHEIIQTTLGNQSRVVLAIPGYLSRTHSGPMIRQVNDAVRIPLCHKLHVDEGFFIDPILNQNGLILRGVERLRKHLRMNNLRPSIRTDCGIISIQIFGSITEHILIRVIVWVMILKIISRPVGGFPVVRQTVLINVVGGERLGRAAMHPDIDALSIGCGFV